MKLNIARFIITEVSQMIEKTMNVSLTIVTNRYMYYVAEKTTDKTEQHDDNTFTPDLAGVQIPADDQLNKENGKTINR